MFCNIDVAAMVFLAMLLTLIGQFFIFVQKFAFFALKIYFIVLFYLFHFKLHQTKPSFRIPDARLCGNASSIFPGLKNQPICQQCCRMALKQCLSTLNYRLLCRLCL